MNRLMGIMLQILIIILLRISSQLLCFYYSLVSLIMLKIILSFDNFDWYSLRIDYFVRVSDCSIRVI